MNSKYYEPIPKFTLRNEVEEDQKNELKGSQKVEEALKGLIEEAEIYGNKQ